MSDTPRASRKGKYIPDRRFIRRFLHFHELQLESGNIQPIARSYPRHSSDLPMFVFSRCLRGCLSFLCSIGFHRVRNSSVLPRLCAIVPSTLSGSSCLPSIPSRRVHGCEHVHVGFIRFAGHLTRKIGLGTTVSPATIP